jgi:hypothetical protein
VGPVAVDPSVVVYVYDGDNACIRRIDTNGVIDAFAGRCTEPALGEVGPIGAPIDEVRLDTWWSQMLLLEDSLLVGGSDVYRIRLPE